MKRSILMVAALGCGGSPTTGPVASPHPSNGAATPSAPPVPPRAEARPYQVPSPHGARSDPYYWLRDDARSKRDVLGYLEAENAYTRAVLGAAREDALFAELKARVQEDDSSPPVLDGGYWYYSRIAAGQQYAVIARRKGVVSAPEEIVLDGNELARGHAFFAMGNYAVSPDGALVAWTDDTVGRGQRTLHVRDLRTGQTLEDTALNVSWGVEWASDSQTLFYVGKDPTTLRQDRVFRHKIGSAEHAQVYQEPDGQFYVSIGHTKSRRYIEIHAGATTTSEVRLIDAHRPLAPIRVALPRERDHLYDLEHLDGRFIVRSNAGAKNFRVIEVADDKLRDRAAWRDVIAPRADAFIDEITVSRYFIAATVRRGGLSQVEVVPRVRGQSQPAFFVEASEPAYAMSVDDQPSAEAHAIRYAYSSPARPRTTFELDVTSRKRTTLHTQPVAKFEASQYAVQYLHAPASDGVEVPIAVVYRKGTPLDGRAPLMVYGYGSYGISQEPVFDAARLPLLDRGWVWAIVNPRGGGELGRPWYDGKLMRKRNTFTDFIAATEYLVAKGFGARDQVFAMGRSAGGLLMGAIANLRPDLYRGIIAGVPFVDVVTTMLDLSIPLTSNEFDEWGDPRDKAAYDYMLSYSPYDNVAAQAYPAIRVTTSLWDSQVQYFEPAKWVAKLRATKTDDNLVVLDIDMSAGHGGKSGRYDKLRDAARNWAFLLHVLEHADRRASWPSAEGAARGRE